MGANYATLAVDSTDPKVVKEAFKQEQERDLWENGHSYSGGLGMARGLAFDGRRFEAEREANFYLHDRCQKWEEAVAVVITGPRYAPTGMRFIDGAWTQEEPRVAHPGPWTLIGAICSS